MTKDITFNPITLQRLQQGVNTIANAVKTTLGPKGRNVVIQNPYGTPHITKDGVTVAKQINLKDPIEDLAAEIMKQAASKTVSTCGDGTTTSIVLAQAIFNEGFKYIQMGMISPIDLKKGLEKELHRVLEYITTKASKIDDPAQLEQIATVSANNDNEIGKLIAEAFLSVGEEGIVMTEDSRSTSTYVEVTKGAKFERGFISPYFINKPEKMKCELEDCLILFYDKKIRAASDIVPVVSIAAKERKPLLIIAEEVEAQALSMLLVNKMQGNLQLCAVKAPNFGDTRTKILEDLAILTNGVVITESTGKTLAQVTLSDLGKAEKVVISRTDTTIVNHSSNEEAIKKRINEIKAEIEVSESSDYDQLKGKQRIAMLAGKVAMLHIGASTEIELKEKKDRVDDAVQATSAALKAGVVPGGGTVYYNASNALGKVSIAKSVMDIALQSPLKTICENAGVSPEVIMNQITDDLGYNAHTDSMENLYKGGIIDPALVLMAALENAVSVAVMLLLTSTAITIVPEDSSNQESHDMGGMYDI